MDDLLQEFLTETSENLDLVDLELIKFEANPNDREILNNIFRAVHTIKGTCGFLGLPRLEAMAHASETVMDDFRNGAPVTPDAVSLVLASIDRIKEILRGIAESGGNEPEGDDREMISQLHTLSDCVKNAANDGQNTEPAQASARTTHIAHDSLPEQDTGLAQQTAAVKMPDLAHTEASKTEALKKEEVPASRAERTAAPHASAEPAGAATYKSAATGTSDGQRHGVTVGNPTIRVGVDTIENLMTMVSELVLTRNQLLEISRRSGESEYKVPLQRLSNVTAELQEGIMKTRMQPIGNAWQKLPRIVRDLARELEKPVSLQMRGADTELDRQVIELIKDPLTHIVRNAADHGLEPADQRTASGKPATGCISLSARHEGGHIIVEIEDDGRGLDTDRIREKALENGIASEARLRMMSEAQIQRLIFHAGFSTATQVTNLSGRGVGMDVVRNNIELIGGTTDVRSVRGSSTTITIKIPLTLAIVSTLIVASHGNRFAIPQMAVVELVRARRDTAHRVEYLKNRPVLRLRDQLLPLMDLGSALQLQEAPDPESLENRFIVVMQVGEQVFGLAVDNVFHTEEIVIKPMVSMLRNLNVFSGNTILGDGSVIMILDPNGIASLVGDSAAGAPADAATTETQHKTERKPDSEVQIPLLLFRAGSDKPKAVPLSLVTRLEEFRQDRIERMAELDLVQYRGALMPLVYVSDTQKDHEKDSRPMLVFSDAGRAMGLVVDEIVDIVEDVMNIEINSRRPGLLGSAIIQGKATEIIDIGYYLPQAFDDWFKITGTIGEKHHQHLLLVEDSAFFRNMITPVLKAAGYHVTTASDAHEALRALEAGTPFNAVLTDIEMPEMDGFEFCKTLRADSRFEKLPVIALSARVESSAIQKGRDAGFDDYVAKFDRQGLMETLRDVFTGDAVIAA